MHCLLFIHKHVEENSILWINNKQCIKLVINVYGLQKAWRHFLKVKVCRDTDFSDTFPVQMCRFCIYLVVLCNPCSLEQIDYTIFNPLFIYLFIVQFVGLNIVYNCPNDVFTSWDSGLKWVNIYYIVIKQDLWPSVPTLKL